MNSLMPHEPSWEYPRSRDWQEIQCNADSCINNRMKQCTVPSLAILDQNGRCKGFKTKDM